MKEKIDHLLEKVTQDKTSSIVSSALLILVSLFLLGIILYYVKFGFSGYILFYMLFLIVGILYYRFSLMEFLKDVDEASNYKVHENVDDGLFQRSKSNYISKGINLKLMRVILIQRLYLCLCPLLLLMFSEIIVGPSLSFGNFLMRLILGVLVGGLFWYFFFNKDKEELYEFQDESDLIQRKL